MKTPDLMALMELWLNDNSIHFKKTEYTLAIEMLNGHWIAIVDNKAVVNVAIPDHVAPGIVRNPTIRKVVEKYSKVTVLDPTDPEFFDKIMALVR